MTKPRSHANVSGDLRVRGKKLPAAGRPGRRPLPPDKVLPLVYPPQTGQIELEINPPPGPPGALSLESITMIEAGGQVMQHRPAMSDITWCRQAEAELRRSEEKFRRLTKLSPVPIAIIDRLGEVEYLNDRFLTTFGYTSGDIPNLEAWWRRAYPDEHHRRKGMANWRGALKKAAQEQKDIEPTVSRVTCQDGTVRITKIFGAIIGDQNLIFLQDITERQEAEEELVRKSDQLRALAARLAEVEEAERQHLARVLHDQVCQGLTALGLTLTLLQTQMPRGTAAALLARLAKAVALVEQTGKTIREVMVELRPPMLDDYGLLAALNWYGVEFFAKTGIGVDVRGQEAVPRLAPPVELALFRIVQEAMTNVAKHAQATGVVLTEEMDNGTLVLVIADNGVGFDQERLGTPEARHLWGLMTMSERAAAAGGRCRIESQPGLGTRVVVEVSR
jgi:two-component system sensor histidine kinase UhpB